MSAKANTKAQISQQPVDYEELAATVKINIASYVEQLEQRVGQPSAPQVIAIVGPTGVGKSTLADQLAQRIDGEIVSADSMQVYRHMDIGTAKVPLEERGVPYHCLDLVEPGQTYSASLYQQDARRAIADILQRGKRPVVCGGTGLYVRAALDAMEFPKGDQENNPVRAYYMQILEQEGAEALHLMLSQRDPEAAALIHPNNTRRVIRAFEMLEEGISYAEQVSGMQTYEAFIQTVYFGLTMETNLLYAAIDARVDQMMQQGLLEEVRSLVNLGFAEAITSSQAIGYKEFLDIFSKKCSLDDAIESVKRSTRRYSKRQRTWFKRDPRIEWLDVAQPLK